MADDFAVLSSILPVAGLRLGLLSEGPGSAFPADGWTTALPCLCGNRLASSRMLARRPKTAVRCSSGTSISPKRMRSPILSVTFLARIQRSFRLRKVPLLEPESLMLTRPSSESSIRACRRDKVECSRTRSQEGSRPHVLVSIGLLTGTCHPS